MGGVDECRKLVASTCVYTCVYIYIQYSIYIYEPRPSKGVKFQPLGLFLVVKFHTLGGSRNIYVYPEPESQAVFQFMPTNHFPFVKV